MQQRSWLKRSVYNFSRVAVRFVGWLFCRLSFLGQENFPDEGPALVCSNHQSFLDPLLLGAMCDRRLNYLARDTLFKTRLFGALIRFYDAIPVKRDGMSLDGVKETLRRLKRQEMVVLFPEGTRTKDGTISPLKPGFCVLARRAKVPLIPVAIDGAYDVCPAGSKLPRPARICLAAGPMITVEEIQAIDDETLIQLVDDRMSECFRAARIKNGREAAKSSSAPALSSSSLSSSSLSSSSLSSSSLSGIAAETDATLSAACQEGLTERKEPEPSSRSSDSENRQKEVNQ